MLDQESSRLQAIGRQAENQLLSGAQRFARLSDSDQQKAILAQQTANQGGRLTDQQRSLLEGIGTFGATDAARRADLQEAREKGFHSIFGGAERQLVDASDRSIVAGDRRELGAARSRLGSTVRSARLDGRVSLEEQQRIQAARAELDLLGAQQGFARDQRTSDRRSSRGFSANEAVNASQRLDSFDQQARQVQVQIQNKQSFKIQLKTDETAAVAAVTKLLRENRRDQESRMQKSLQAGLDGLRQEFREALGLDAQQVRNSVPS